MQVIYELDNNAYVPEYGTSESAGMDFRCTEDFIIPPGGIAMINTYVKLIIPENHYLLIRSRSSIASKFGVEVMAGVIDSDYRGYIKILLHNTTKDRVEISKGTKIAQGILQEYVKAELIRGTVIQDQKHLGFGSTDC